MININLVCVGKLKESFWRDAAAEYSKRLGKYAAFKIIELPESKLSDKPGDREIEAALAAEAKLMKPYLTMNRAYNIAMCIEGKMLSSEELAKNILDSAAGGASVINFYIGSSFGLDGAVKSSADLKLSISRMTLPHQLARVVLSEQIYRAMSINANAKYHK